MKTNKSLAKRIRVTRTGKLKARKPGFNHFNAKQKRRKQLQGKTAIDMVLTNKAKARFFPFTNTKVRKPKVLAKVAKEVKSDNK